jgi:glutamate carboxypeptidase
VTSPTVIPPLSDSARARALATLERYVLRETPTGDLEASTAFVEELTDRYTALGASVVHHPVAGGVHLVADWPGSGAFADAPPLLLVGHSDTVWPVGTLDSAVPWTNDGERITGPGAYDMKSGLVVIEEALELLLSTEGPADRRPVRLIVTADEEIGSPTSGELLLSAAEGCAAAIGFESPHPDGSLKVGRLGSTRINIAVTGVPAHAALDPDKGVSATEEIVDQLLRVREIAAQATERAASSSDTTILYNLGSITAPGRANVVSDDAAAELGFRFSDVAIEQEVLGEIGALTAVRAGATVEVTRLSHRPAWKPRAADVEFAESISRIAQATLGAPLDQRPAAGGADTNLLGASDIGVVDGFGPSGGGAHARSEHIVIASFWQRIELLAAVIAAPPVTAIPPA